MSPSSSHRRSSTQKRAVLSERASQMRHAATASEAWLFEALRGGCLGVTFRRPVPVLGRVVADFLASKVKLVVEIDGGYYAAREAADARREKALVRAGYRVVWLEAELVMRDVEAAVARVAVEVERLRCASSH